MSRKAANQPATWALTSAQTHALFDILTHHETYGEVERFKLPGFISRFGHPFLPLASPAGLEHGQDGADSTADEALDSGGPDSASSTPNVSAAPLIATLFRTVVLTAPGLKLLSPTFWNVQARGLLDRFADAELSESYDKGTLGTRKTLATAASVLQESLVRGMLGGVWHGGGKRDLRGPYDARTAVDLVRAWEDVVHELAYGGLIDELFECAMTNGNVEKHSPAAERCVDYIILQYVALSIRWTRRGRLGHLTIQQLGHLSPLCLYSFT